MKTNEISIENIEKEKKTKTKKINKKAILIIFILSLLTCGIFLRFHLVSDTYWNIGEGYEKYKLIPLKDGRIINFLILSIAEYINIPFEIYQLIMMIGSILCYNYAVYTIFIFLKEKINNKQKIIQAIILLGSFLIIYNPMTVETFAYTEMVIPLSILLFTKAAILLNMQNENKIENIIKCIICVILGSLCYQGTICFFAVISIFCFSINKENKIKDYINFLVKVLMIYAIGILLMFVVLNISNALLGKSRDDFELSVNILYKLKIFIKLSIHYLIKMPFDLFPKYLIIVSIIISLILIAVTLRKEKCLNVLKNIIKYIFIIIVAVISANCIMLIQETVSIAARTSLSIGAIIGISIIYILFTYLNYTYKPKEKNNEKIKEYDNIFVILISLSIVFVLINMYNYNNLAIQNQITQKKDEIYLSKINECIVKYEKENNIKITKVVFKKEIPYYDTYNGYDSNIFTCKGIVANYSNIWCLNYYTGRNLEKINDNETFDKLFSRDKINYQEFNEKQIKFLDETVYIRIY